MSIAPAITPALYVGQVMHHRMKPKVHRFTYDVFSCLLDLDRLDETNMASKLFSVDCFNLIAFHQKDHGDGQSDSLATHAREKLAAVGAANAGHRIVLLAYPRILGFVFNPLSVYYCFERDGRLGALIYEVSNTFGERHTYVAPVAADERNGDAVRQDCRKAFYVSPFLDMPMHYKFRLTSPGETLRFRILEDDAEGPILAATFSAERKPFTTGTLLRVFFGLPLMTLKVVTAIHWEALRLWWKGVPLVRKPTFSADKLRQELPTLAHARKEPS